VDPDLELLARWRAGDKIAGQELFSRHFAEIYRFLENKLGDEADDVAQRTFLACVRGRDQFRGDSSFRTYLFAIARHEIHGWLRRQPRGEHVDLDETSIAEIATSPSSRLGRAQAIDRLRLALLELPAENQLLLELHYWHDLDAAALALVFETNPGAIRVRLLRARRQLREKLREFGPDETVANDRLSRSLVESESDEPG
jgi:RNA polymerase sigma-70 factor (ECF subfamily)